MRALILFPLLALAGCQTVPVVTVPPEAQRTYLRDVTPESLLHCQPEPSGAGVKTNRQAARYVLALKGAGRDCRQKLDAAGELIRHEQ